MPFLAADQREHLRFRVERDAEALLVVMGDRGAKGGVPL